MPLSVNLILPPESNRVRAIVSNLLAIDDNVAFARELGALSFEKETEEVSSLQRGCRSDREHLTILWMALIDQIANFSSFSFVLDLPQLG